jgi:GNAT superfamily N-acetyltransferase
MKEPLVEIVQDASGILAVQELWAEYWESLGLSPDFQNFARELQTLPGRYAPPEGRLLLLRVDGRAVGTAAFRPLGESACEAKRLYVRPVYRNRGIGSSMLETLIMEARLCGYRNVYADTLTSMTSALDLYRRIGFVEVGPYSDDPTPGAFYLRLSL